MRHTLFLNILAAEYAQDKDTSRRFIEVLPAFTKAAGGPAVGRVFSEHRCEAAAPTEPAGETSVPRSPTVIARRSALGVWRNPLTAIHRQGVNSKTVWWTVFEEVRKPRRE